MEAVRVATERSFLLGGSSLETTLTIAVRNKSTDLMEGGYRMRYLHSTTFFVKFEGNVCQFSLPSLSSNFFLSHP